MSQSRRSAALVVLWMVLMLPVAACGSLARYRVPARIVSPTRTLEVELWSSDESYHQVGYLLIGDLLFWPFDAIVSLHWGFAAMLDRDLAIRGGPFGLLAAMVLPCCTAHGGEQGRRLVRGKSRLANPSILPVSEQDLDDYLAGALALEDLTIRGLGAAYRAVVRRSHGVGFAAAEDVLVRVRDGVIAVTRAGGVVARSP